MKPDEVGYSTQDTDNIESDSSSSGSPNSERETPRKRGSPTPPSSDSSDESVLIAPKRKKNPAYALTPGHDESFQGTEVPNLVPGSVSSAATLMNATAEYIWSKSLWFVGRIVLWLGMLFQDTPPLYLTEISKTERI